MKFVVLIFDPNKHEEKRYANEMSGSISECL